MTIKAKVLLMAGGIGLLILGSKKAKAEPLPFLEGWGSQGTGEGVSQVEGIVIFPGLSYKDPKTGIWHYQDSSGNEVSKEVYDDLVQRGDGMVITGGAGDS